jgi:hypothetical protein
MPRPSSSAAMAAPRPLLWPVTMAFMRFSSSAMNYEQCVIGKDSRSALQAADRCKQARSMG